MNKWKTFLEKIDKEFREHPSDWLRQPTISKTMHPGNRELTRKYLNKLTLDFKILRDPYPGNPKAFEEGFSLSTAQNCYYLEHIFDNLDSYDHITEIGGGYGGLYRCVRRSLWTGTYDIVDFPLMHKIQKEYILQCALDLPNFYELETPPKKYDPNSLLIANFSMNEMPYDDREKVWLMLPEFEKIVIQYSPHFDGIDNIEYFKRLKEALDSNILFETETFKCPVHPTSHFLIIRRV